MSHSKFAIQNSSFSRYPKYKDSGVEWLGEVPEHWSLKRFKRMLHEREERSEEGNELLLSVSAYTGVSPRSEVIDEGDHLSRAASLVGYKVCYKDDLVMNIMLAWNRGLAFSKYHGIVSPAYCVFDVIDDSDPDFLNYLVRSDEYTLYFKAFSSGVIDSRLRIYPDTFGGLLCGLPPKKEQTAIAAFLDRETAKIDGLVAEQRRLMELLKEKRQAVISAAVTGRFVMANAELRMANDQLERHDLKSPVNAEPNREGQYQAADGRFVVLFQDRLALAPPDLTSSHLRHSKFAILNSRPSGIEWLGDLPEHWEVRSVSSLTTKITNGYVGPTRGILVDEGVRYLQSLHIKQNQIRFNTPYYVTEEWSNEKEKSILEAGDVLVVQTGDIGQVAVVPEEFAGCNCHALIILAPRREEVSGEWMSWVLNSDYGFHCLQAIKTGALHPHLNCGNVKFLKLPLPPEGEQTEIVKFIADRLGEFDTLTAETQRAIDLLQERRTALISAAVTGQIDVRQIQQENQNDA